jgi:hypothetical protein
MLNWNAAKLKNLTPTEIWCFIVARVFIGFGFGVLATQRYPHTAGVLALPVLLVGFVTFIAAAKGLRRPSSG